VLVGIFIKVTPFAERSGMSEDDILHGVEKYIRKYFGKRGEKVVQENLECVKHGLKEVQEISQDITHSEEPANHGELAATN
jgi:pyruvate-ferredoxin/flavodoxin oxidoreductase